MTIATQAGVETGLLTQEITHLTGRQIVIQDRRGRKHSGLVKIKRKRTTRNTGRTLWVGNSQLWEIQEFAPLTIIDIN